MMMMTMNNALSWVVMVNSGHFLCLSEKSNGRCILRLLVQKENSLGRQILRFSDLQVRY